MEHPEFDPLKLENQLCFPLYACSKEIIRRYKPFLDPLDLTYTQYITLLVLWEKKTVNVKELGDRLYLDSGTLTPLLKKLEAKGLVTRTRSSTDERSVDIALTDAGAALRQQAAKIPEKMGSCVSLSQDDAQTLYRLLYAVINNLPE